MSGGEGEERGVTEGLSHAIRATSLILCVVMVVAEFEAARRSDWSALVVRGLLVVVFAIWSTRRP